MNTTLKTILKRLSSKKIMVVSLIFTVAITFILSKIEKKVIVHDTMNFFHLQISFSETVFNEIIRSWGDKGVAFYLKTLWVDFLYAIVYALLLSSAILFFKGKKADFSYDNLTRLDISFIILPFFAAMCDHAENVLHIMILSRKMQGLVFKASVVSSVKWAALTTSLAYFLVMYFSFRKEMRDAVLSRR